MRDAERKLAINTRIERNAGLSDVMHSDMVRDAMLRASP
jgi:hypothetical protein